ncbi:MAG TPA: CoA transferase [Chloroflexota bacterium]|nr:CoA transferase [Chloroflexota bacterium]
MQLPLEGKRVLDLTRNVAGPFATQILAGFGADVIKVEHPGGDDTRTWGPPFWGDQSPVFLAANRDKRAITLDLKQPEARTILERAIERSDVLVESFRPGALEQLGFGYDWARERNARIIYTSVTAYGDTGPMRDMPGYDPIMQAYSGIMSVTGEPDRPPIRAGVSVVDLGTGMWAAMATLAALMEAEHTGQGTRVVTSLYETSLNWMGHHINASWGTGKPSGRWGTGAAMLAPYEAFQTQDGYLMISCGNDRLFAQLASILGRDEWTRDERFVHNPERVHNRAALKVLIEEQTRGWATDKLSQALTKAGVPNGPIRDSLAVTRDDQAEALGIFQGFPHPSLEDFKSIGLPFTLDGERPPLKRVPPSLGQHNREVLCDLGFAEQDIERLVGSAAMMSA